MPVLWGEEFVGKKRRMHMNRNLLWITLLLSLSWFLGVVSPWQTEAAPSLDTILAKTEARYQQLRAYTADFDQWTTSAATNTITTEASGKLYYQKPRKMCWKYKVPEAQTFIVNRQYAWLHVPSENQISLFDTKAFFSSPLARTFFDGIFELKKHFKVL